MYGNLSLSIPKGSTCQVIFPNQFYRIDNLLPTLQTTGSKIRVQAQARALGFHHGSESFLLTHMSQSTQGHFPYLSESIGTSQAQTCIPCRELPLLSQSTLLLNALDPLLQTGMKLGAMLCWRCLKFYYFYYISFLLTPAFIQPTGTSTKFINMTKQALHYFEELSWRR